jgi:long-subunit fatty acid transport protein
MPNKSCEYGSVQPLRRNSFAVLLLASFIVAVTSSPRTVGAEAFRILPQGAVATGQGGAFVAQADDPSAIHYNPAGMTQLRGVQVSAGTSLLGGSISYKGPGGMTSRGDLSGSVAILLRAIFILQPSFVTSVSPSSAKPPSVSA